MHRLQGPLMAAAALISGVAATTPALAQTAVDPANVRAEDVALSPLSDMNIVKKGIPVVLSSAISDPYSLDGIATCAGLTTAIVDLDVALGDDIDVATGKTRGETMGNSAGAIAKSLIGSFIPFRGVIREVTGANAHQKAWDRALYAGSVRRAFLKGVGKQRGCAYPASPATPQVIAALRAPTPKVEHTKGEAVAVPAPVLAAGPTYTATPVVQTIASRR
jgi:hypothetical protein